jgi:hypothetical protein
MCWFGYKALERNRYAECVFCPHKICEDCLEWNRENVVEMESEDAANLPRDDTNWSPLPPLRDML